MIIVDLGKNQKNSFYRNKYHLISPNRMKQFDQSLELRVKCLSR